MPGAFLFPEKAFRHALLRALPPDCLLHPSDFRLKFGDVVLQLPNTERIEHSGFDTAGPG